MAQAETGIAEFKKVESIVTNLVTVPQLFRGSESTLSTLSHALLAALEILRSASCVPPSKTLHPSLDPCYTQHLVQITGCSPWVFENLSQITALRKWKHESTLSHCLNVVELANRGTRIENDLQHHLQVQPMLTETIRNKSTIALTEIYACAAQVYLHVVVSGAFPGIAEIRQAVVKAINAFQRLEYAQLLRRLAWPVCVVACMAGHEHTAFFQRMEKGARGDGDSCVNVLRALEVAHECRRLRETETGKHSYQAVDWFDAMKSLHKEYILF